ncbi:MAG: flagellar export chaperone FliS [Gammaproteobacteria bacterium]|nr:flagellar export chaperone FliS [Gammaproteobacteria bacterium]
MSYASSAFAAYKSVDLHTQIEGASPHELVNLLYQGALDKIAKMRGHIQNGDTAAKGEEAGKIIAIVSELQASLSTENGSDISDNLDALYTYIIELVVAANVNNNTKSLDEAKDLVANIQETWKMIPPEHHNRTR